jgi:hypothetical protein
MKSHPQTQVLFCRITGKVRFGRLNFSGFPVYREVPRIFKGKAEVVVGRFPNLDMPSNANH